jgi:hypothetical protein
VTTRPKRIQNVQRIDHIVFFYRTRERADDTRDKMSAVFGLAPEDWDEAVEIGAPLNAVTQLCWSAGLEIACATPGFEDSWIGKPLIDERGEGLHMVAFGVKDIDEANRRATNAGFVIAQTIQDPRHPDPESSKIAPEEMPLYFPEGLHRPHSLIREAIIVPFNGLNLAFAQIEPGAE